MKRKLKLVFWLFVIGFSLKILLESSVNTSPPVSTAPAKEVKADPVNTARVVCRMLVKDAAEYRDTVKFQNIIPEQTPEGDVIIKLNWSAENRFGTSVRHESLCIYDDEVTFFTVNDKVLIEKSKT
ncbi:hypothetical protein [uncultured Endozoicomonas sp.]|uniref:hypothetical protein n=1 Tax=uncultured Endozoicomonas sp. TaxID=432652 RepID=UPI00260E9AC8|nr:hypothetical protein [uncultured Endozoicomonas sp.]